MRISRSVINLAAGALGALIPLALLKVEAELESPVVVVVWPSSAAVRVPHIWPSERETAVFFAIVILLNAILYSSVAVLATRRLARPVTTNESRSGRVILLFGWSSLIAVIATVAVLGRPIFYKFPSDYRGWAVVEYANPSCPPLTSRGIDQVVEFPPSGRLCTSSAKPIPDAWRRVMYGYVSAGAWKRLFPCDLAGADVCVVRISRLPREGGSPQRAIFLGTPSEFRTARSETPR
jgi:hypothetical protein